MPIWSICLIIGLHWLCILLLFVMVIRNYSHRFGDLHKELSACKYLALEFARRLEELEQQMALIDKEVCPADKATEVDISEGSDPGDV